MDFGSETLALHTMGRFHSRPHDLRGLTRRVTREFLIIDRLDFDVWVDPVEERTADALAVITHHVRRATALAFQVPVIATRARGNTRSSQPNQDYLH